MRWICGSRCPARCPWMTSPPSWGTLRAARCATGSRRIPGTTPTSASTAPSPCSQARGDKARGRGGDRRPGGPGDGADPQQVRYSVWEGTPEGARRRCCRRPRGRGGGERPWTREDPPGEPAGPPDALRAAAGAAGGAARRPGGAQGDHRRPGAQQRRAQEVLAVLKAGAPALTNAEAAGCASRLEGAFGAAAACAATRPSPLHLLLPARRPDLALRAAGRDGGRGRAAPVPPGRSASTATRRRGATGSCARSVSRRRGRPVSEKVVRRLMRGLGLRVCYARRRGRYSSYAGEIDAPAPNLLLRADGTHDFSAGRPNEAWVSDVTEFRLSPTTAAKVKIPVARRRPVRRQAVGWAWSAPAWNPTRASPSRPSRWRARRSGGGGARRAHRPRLPLPLARASRKAIRAPRAGQVDVAQRHQPRQRRLRGVLRQPEEL